jgi:diadenosine tetraphosphate (Ap4A) HIT family hydrolase
MDCPFCTRIAAEDVITRNSLAAALFDGFPVSPGHALIVPVRHEGDFFSLTQAEQESIWSLIPAVRQVIEAEHSPAGYNIGVNVGVAAGQTILHAHLHLIPRYDGDVPDARGGVRWIIPSKAAYWKKDNAT